MHSIEFVFVETNEVVRSNSNVIFLRGKNAASARAVLRKANAER